MIEKWLLKHLNTRVDKNTTLLSRLTLLIHAVILVDSIHNREKV